MRGKLVSYTCHQPENAPKLARKVNFYLIRFSVNFKFTFML